MKINKIIALIMAISMILMVPAYASFSDVATTDYFSPAVERLCVYNIINGKGDGSFDPSGTLTRGELAKISAVISGLSEMASSYAGISLFSDISPNHWANGYINVVAKNNIILGYPNGTFAPDEVLNFSQATTVVLRLLGYTTEDLGNNWPNAYLAKAAEIGITDGYNLGAYDAINRGDFAVLVDRALFTEMKKASADLPKSYLIEKPGFKLSAECTLKATAKNDDTLASGDIKTTVGNYKSLINMDEYLYSQVQLIFNKDNKVVGAILAKTQLNKSDFVVKVLNNEQVEGANVTLSSDDLALLNLMGYSQSMECIITATNNTDTSVMSGNIKTSLGNYKSVTDNVDNYLYKKVKLITNTDKEVVAVIPVKDDGVIKQFIVNSVVNKELNFLSDGISSTVTFDDNTQVYYLGALMNYASVLTKIQQGSIMYVYYTSKGSIDFAVLTDANVIGPVTVQHNITNADVAIGTISIDNANLRITRDGKTASKSDIKHYDVAYYLKDLNTLSVYSTKKTGTYDKAYPDKATVNKISLSGMDYDLGTSVAVSKLNNSASAYNIGDKITILLGKDGTVTDVVSMGDEDVSDYGILLGTSKGTSTQQEDYGAVNYLASILLTDGTTQTFVCDRDYTDSSNKGCLVKMTFANKTVSLNSVSENKTVGGVLDKNTMKLGDLTLSKNVKIFEQTDVPTPGDISARLVELYNVNLSEIDASEIISVVTGGDFKDIQVIYIRNILKDNFQYGVLMSAKSSINGMSSSGSYELNFGSTTKSFSTNGSSFTTAEGSLVGAKIRNNQLVEMFPLLPVDSGTKIEACDGSRIRINGTNYRLSDNIVVFDRTDTYKGVPMSINNIMDQKTSGVTLYSDKLDNPTIRLIVVTLSK